MDTNRNLTSMAKKSLIQREKKRQKLEQEYHLIRRSSKEEISKVRSLSDKWEIYGKLQSPPQNMHLRDFIDVVFQLEGQELTTETLDYPDTYFVKWFMHVCYQGRQDRVGKD
ncbi:putative ribosomal protein S14 [Helianthus anomalus]